MKTAFFVLLILCVTNPLSGKEVGLASWYGGKFQGRLTASGEVFDTNKLTAAHKSLAFGTVVEVTNLLNNRSVKVRINDRGPFVAGRIIDLSRAAADAIGMTARGVTPVRVRILEIPKSETATDWIYHIQVGAYRKQSNAIKTRKRLQELGFEASLERTDTGVHRVLVVNVPGNKLEETEKTLRIAGFTRVLLRKVRS